MSAPWTSEFDEFLALLLASRLVDLETILRECDVLRQDRNVDAFCAHLCDRGILTEWQCGKLCNGQFKGFILGNYCLREPVERVGAETIYAATDFTTSKTVELAVQRSEEKPHV